MDAQTLEYRSDAAAAIGVSLDQFPDICASHEVIGQVTQSAAEETGLPEGLPVVAGGGDFLVAMLGSGVVEFRLGSDVTGTSTLISVLGKNPLPHPVISNLCVPQGGWVAFTLIDAGGDSMRWARRTFSDPAPLLSGSMNS